MKPSHLVQILETYNFTFLGNEYFLSIEPVVVEGEEDLLNVAHEKRSCFFQVSISSTFYARVFCTKAN